MQHRRPTSGSSSNYQKLRTRVSSLLLFHDVLDGPVGESFNVLVDALSDDLFLEDHPESELIEMLTGLLAALQTDALDDVEAAVGDLWQNHCLNRVVGSRNLFTIASENLPVEDLDRGLLQKARADLRTLQAMHDTSLNQLQRAVRDVSPESRAYLEHAWSDWGEFRLYRRGRPLDPTPLHNMKLRLAAAKDWGDLANELARYTYQAGAGVFGRFRAFYWDGLSTPPLIGITTPDPVRLSDLTGYEREQDAVIRNTRRFVRGAPGNNVLLYGDAGTGKSSFVKALFNEFEAEGLRLIEVDKEDMVHFPEIVRPARGRRERFIVFVDDLSFEESETEYKGLKAVLEGGIEARPENVLIYATSNRRHLVREGFGDRAAPGSDDVHPFETMQEKISLSERFGLRVAFLAPDQERYLGIVNALAANEGIRLPADELRRRALQWAQWQNGFSGRTARQFINDLIGALAEA